MIQRRVGGLDSVKPRRMRWKLSRRGMGSNETVLMHTVSKNHLDLERDWDEAMAKLSKVYEHS